ncbi:hypothetical protein [Amycolatopsis sp. NPDC059021]|uniref:hypothetical protein n=1 Tax=Amycolatopsis sp. NPDC059021 TaxID=3346704 RepID=UPI00366E5EBB
MRIKHRAVGAFTGALLLFGLPLASANATEPSSANSTASPASAKATPTVVPHADGLSSPADCWTTFVPPSPQGGAMDHYYKNCNGYAITVTTGYRNSAGQITVLGGGNIVTLANQETASWHYNATERGVQYSTIIVR